MKQTILFTILLSLFSFCSSAQSALNAENPIAYQYLLKHFQLKGKVKSVTTYGSNNYLMTDELFDTEGRITTSVSYSGMSSTNSYTYDKGKNQFTVSYKSGSLSPINSLFQYNKEQEVEFSLYKDNDPLRKYEYSGGVMIKDSSANRFSTQKVYYSYYEYNKKGQLIKLINYNGDGKMSREEMYTYDKSVVTVNGRNIPSYPGGKESRFERKSYYDANGSLLRSTYTEDGKTDVTEYKLDQNGNWIWKTGGMTRKIVYY